MLLGSACTFVSSTSCFLSLAKYSGQARQGAGQGSHAGIVCATTQGLADTLPIDEIHACAQDEACGRVGQGSVDHILQQRVGYAGSDGVDGLVQIYPQLTSQVGCGQRHGARHAHIAPVYMIETVVESLVEDAVARPHGDVGKRIAFQALLFSYLLQNSTWIPHTLTVLNNYVVLSCWCFTLQ